MSQTMPANSNATQRFVTEACCSEVPVPNVQVYGVGQRSGHFARVLGFDAGLGIGVARTDQGYNFVFTVGEKWTWVDARGELERTLTRFEVETIGIDGVIMADVGEQMSGSWKITVDGATAIGA